VSNAIRNNRASHRRMVISLTTTPVRIRFTREMLTALADQTGEFSAILINIPYRLSRTGEAYEIPEWMSTIEKLRVNRCTDYGPATKLLGALECERDPDTLIVTVDDDVLYPTWMVEAYRRCAASNDGCAYCMTGFNIPDPSAVAVKLERGALQLVEGDGVDVQVAAGYGSCLYKRSFFDDTIFDVPKLPDFLVYSDDIYISNYLAARHIGIKTVLFDGCGGVDFWDSRLLPYGLERDALHRNPDIGTNRERYSLAVDYLIKNNDYYLDRLQGRSFPAHESSNQPATGATADP
jgi:hypothetical protein